MPGITYRNVLESVSCMSKGYNVIYVVTLMQDVPHISKMVQSILAPLSPETYSANNFRTVFSFKPEFGGGSLRIIPYGKIDRNMRCDLFVEDINECRLPYSEEYKSLISMRKQKHECE